MPANVRDVTVQIDWPDGRVSVHHVSAADVRRLAEMGAADWQRVARIAEAVGSGARPAQEEIFVVADAALVHAHGTQALVGASVVGVDCTRRAIWTGSTLRRRDTGA